MKSACVAAVASTPRRTSTAPDELEDAMILGSIMHQTRHGFGSLPDPAAKCGVEAGHVRWVLVCGLTADTAVEGYTVNAT